MRYLLALVVLCVALVQPVSAEWKIVKLIEAPSVMSFDVNKDGSLVAYNTPAIRDIIRDGKLTGLDSPTYGGHLHDVKKGQDTLLLDRAGNRARASGMIFSPINNQLVSVGSTFDFWSNGGVLQRYVDHAGGGPIHKARHGSHFLGGALIWTFSGSFKSFFLDEAKHVAISSDGKHIVAVGKRHFNNKDTDGKYIKVISPIAFSKWNAGGQQEHFVCVGEAIEVNVFAGETGERSVYFDKASGSIKPIGNPSESAGASIGIACSEDAEESVIACADGSLIIITGNTTTPKYIPGVADGALSIQNHSVAMSDDGKTIAVGRTVNLASSGTAGTAPNQEIALWQDRIPKVLTGHTSTVTKVMFLNDTTLVSTDEGGVIGIWDLKSEETKVEFITGKGPAEDIKISQDNRTIAVLQKGSGILVLKTDAKKEPPVLKPKKATKKEVAGGKR